MPGRPARLAHRGGAAPLLPDQQGALGPARSQRAVRPGRAGEARVGQLLSRPARRRTKSRNGLDGLSGAAKDAATGFFTTIRRGEKGFVARALQHRVPGRAGARGRAAARGGAAHRQRHAEEVPDGARRRVPVERLLRERRRVDGARRGDRADDRSLRGLRGRVVQRQGGVRSLHHRARRSGVEEAAGVQRSPAGAREQPADRSEVSQPEARRARADPRGQRRLRGGRRQPRRADGGLQPAQRRAGGQGEGHQARDAQERAGREVQDGAAADLEDRAAGGGPGEDLVRRLLHAHPDARADARSRPAQRSPSAAARRRCGRS